MNLSEPADTNDKKRKVKTSSSENDTSLDLGHQSETKAEIKQKKKKSKQNKEGKQTTLDSFTSVEKTTGMDAKINKIEKALDLVLSNMLKVSDLDEKLKPLITREQMDTTLLSLKQDIERKNEEMVERMESRMYDLELENDTLKTKIRQLEEQIQEQSVPKVTNDISKKVNDLEQQGRKNNIRIFGLDDINDEETAEECVQKVVKMVNDNLEIPLTASDIDIAHRLGKYSGSKPRAVLCKLISRRSKAAVLQKRRKLKGTKMGIVEDLTLANRALLEKVKAVSCVKNSWSTDGKIFVLLTNDKKLKITHDMSIRAADLLSASVQK